MRWIPFVISLVIVAPDLDVAQGQSVASNYLTEDSLTSVSTFDSQLLDETVQTWVGDKWVNENRKERLYDEAGTWIGWLTGDWINGEWVFEGHRRLVELDSDSVIVSISESFLDGAWIRKERLRSVYDETGNRIDLIVQVWQNGEWVNSHRTRQEFEGPLRVSDTRQEWNGSEWIDLERGFERYDSLGREIEAYSIIWQDSSWQNQSRSVRDFDDLNNRLEVIRQVGSGQAWVNFRRNLSIFDVSGRRIEYAIMYWTDGAWLNYYLVRNGYESSGRLVYREEHDPNGADDWTPSWREYFSFDGSGRYTGRLGQAWRGSGWENCLREKLAYDSGGEIVERVGERWTDDEWTIVSWTRDWNERDDSGNIVLSTTQVWNGSVFVNSRRTIRSFMTSVGAETNALPSPPDHEYELVLFPPYPNPVRVQATVSYHVGAATDVSLSVVDLLGRRITSVFTGRRSGSNKLIWQPREIPSGVYYLVLEAHNQRVVQQVVVTR